MSVLFPLVARNAETSRRGKRLVGPIDLTIAGHGVTVVIGPNGSGKTSLLRLLHGAARCTSGQIEWACDLDTARAKQAFVFQRPVMLRRSVRENLMYPLQVRGATKTNAAQQAKDWAAKVGLETMLERPAPVLSGGEQQKLALARALIADPDLVFLDEPCAALDGQSTREIETLLQATAEQGTRIILSTHDMGQARRLASDVVFLLNGRIHETASAQTFFSMPATQAAQAFLRGDIVE